MNILVRALPLFCVSLHWI